MGSTKSKPKKKVIEVSSKELDMFAKYGVTTIKKGNTTIKLNP
jgi:hypothetical protein